MTLEPSLRRSGPAQPRALCTAYEKGSRVLLTDHPWPDLDIERSIIEGAGFELVPGPTHALTPREIREMVVETDPVAVMTCWAQVDAQAIASPRSLAIVQRIGVGLDNIAVDAATQRGCWVANVPDYCVSEVSDHAIALLLAYFRNVVELDRAVKVAGWNPTLGRSERLSDLTVGIIGLGRIGRETARKLSAFGCRIVAPDRKGTEAAEPIELVEMSRLQLEADAIILHLPLNDESRHLIDYNFLSACAKRPVLVNVSRGEVVENEGLRRALSEGLLGGAALDTIEGEPAPPDYLMKRPDIIVTPHIAFRSTASLAELRRRSCEEVVRVLSGSQPVHACNRP